MEEVFLRVLRMSLAGGVVILLILPLRLMLRRAPRKYAYGLWPAAAFRLLVPVSLPSPVSLFRLLARPVAAGEAVLAPRVSPLLPAGTEALAVGNVAPASAAAAPAVPAVSGEAAFPWLQLLAWAWLAGAAALLLYGLISGVRLRRRLRTAIRQREGYWCASEIGTPFVLGLLRPRIYVPWGLEGEDLENALAHENAHLRRGDPWWRLLSWLLVCLHWFNPLCWLAYLLSGRDMELSCDEAVLARRGDAGKYGESLLHIAAGDGPLSPSLPAFGELGVRQRVKHAMRWKPAGKWASALTALVCLLFFFAAVTDAQALVKNPQTLTLNADGTVGDLRWGMTVEEARAACPELTFVESDGGVRPWAVYASLPEVRFQGYPAEVTFCFMRYEVDEGIYSASEGLPLLLSYEIVIPGYAQDLTEKLEAILGPRETHQRDLSGQQPVTYVEGAPRPPYEERVLPEEEWYWHSGESAADLVRAEDLRRTVPAWRGMTDRELLEVWCYTYGWDARIRLRHSWDGVDTAFVAAGEGYAYRRLLTEKAE